MPVVACAAVVVLVWYGSEAGWWREFSVMIQRAQRLLHGRLADAMRAVQENQSLAIWNLALLGFLYGVFHAAGPGHGKFVIATYVATTESGARRGIGLTLASSFLQGLTAIAVVEGTVRILGLALRDARSGASAVETASYVLLAMVGAGLMFAAFRRLWRRWRGNRHHGAGPSPHGHDHDHAHAHGPDGAVLAQPMKASHALAIVFSVGLRPCSGAILVLLFAKVMGLTAAGIAAVVAISAGTALTVAMLAMMAVYARRMALAVGRRVGAGEMRLAAWLDAAGVAGGLVIVIIALSLLQAALSVARHPLL